MKAKTPKISEAEQVRDLVSKETGARFEVIKLSEENPLPIKDLEWFVRCRNAEDIKKTPYLNVVWKLRKGPIWLESLAIGDTFEWIEFAYGQEASGESLDLNYSDFQEKGFRKEFNTKYPLVDQRIRTAQFVAEQTSKKYKTHLELRSSGSKGIVVFTFAASVTGERPARLKSIPAAVAALREAYQQATQS